MKKTIFLLAAFVAIGCNQHQAEQKADTPMVTAVAKDTAKAGLRLLTYAIHKDPSCGMPLKAGLEDTASYKGKLYGFCSKECKDAFVKNPEQYIHKLTVK